VGGLQNVPAPVLTNVLFKSLSAGNLVTCGIARTGGGVYCWGSNNFGEAGIGAASNNVPVSAVVPPQL
jgi:alpha-tubulin suppressor-like RCC1 family protein